MFRREGLERSVAQNCAIAGYLAFLGGFVNCAGFVILGAFTSHVTGNVARFGWDLAHADSAAAASAAGLIVAFFVGALVSSMMIESGVFGRRANAYAVALTTEAVVLALSVIIARRSASPHERIAAVQALALCSAMGMQNSLVTRLSGAVVRTTHLTGVITDLGIEVARWFRWWRWRVAIKLGAVLAFGRNPAEQPAKEKVQLLATIAIAFTTGSLAGALASLRFPAQAMGVPIVALLACAIYAFFNGRNAGVEGRPRTSA